MEVVADELVAVECVLVKPQGGSRWTAGTHKLHFSSNVFVVLGLRHSNKVRLLSLCLANNDEILNGILRTFG